MGDRAVIHFAGLRVNEPVVSPAVYLHWDGHGVEELLRALFDLMSARGPDVAYTCARCIGLAHERIDGVLSLGTWNAPEGGLAAIRAKDYSHGDAGVFLVHMDEKGWRIETFGGYGFSRGDDDYDRDDVREYVWPWPDPVEQGRIR